MLPGTDVAVSPLPGAYDASPYTQVSLLGTPASALSAISVSGSSSGPHSGSLVAYSQGDGASFVPSNPFQPGETVTVAVKTADDVIRVEVTDLSGPGVPQPRPSGSEAEDGRGFISLPALPRGGGGGDAAAGQ